MPDEQSKASPGPSAATQLVELAQETYTFGVTTDGEPYALKKPGGHVIRPLRGGGSLRAELARKFQRTKHKVAGQAPLADALLVLEGEALEADPRVAHLRVAERDGAVWIDVGDTAETALRIHGGHWQHVTHDIPVLFRRTKLTGALPQPTAGAGRAGLDRLWSHVNIEPGDRPLTLAWLVCALITPDAPHPVLAVLAEQGSGKTTASRLLVSLVDPSPVELRKPPRDPDGWVTAAAGSWVVALDNLSTVPDWLSDSLCRAVTGDGDVRRQLYSDGGLHVVAFRRVILLNGIDVGSMRGDLAERLVVLNLKRITEDRRRREADLAARIAEDRPAILGGLLDLAARVHQLLPDIHLERAPRMADFAAVLAAVDELLGTDGLARYSEQARTIAADTLTADPFLKALHDHLDEEFTGSAAELLERVTPANSDWRPGRDWPKQPRSVTALLRRNAAALRSAGWVVEDLGADGKEKVTKWNLKPPAKEPNTGTETSPEIDGFGSPPTPPTPPSQVRASERAGKAGKGGVHVFEVGGVAGKAGQKSAHPPHGSPTPSCAVCGQPMGFPEPGQDTHPGCDRSVVPLMRAAR